MHRRMRNKMYIFLAFAFLLAGSAWCAGKEEGASPEALISRARQQGEIWTDGTPPMRMRAEIQVLGSKEDLVPGSYTFVWFSPSRWREEIRFGGYERIRVGDSGGYWKSGLEYQPESIFQLDMLLNLREVLKVGPKQTLGKTKNRDKNGVREKCTEVKWSSGTERTICLDEASGSLLSVDYPTRQYQNAPEISRIEYSTFKSVGEKLVPFEIRALRDRKPVAAVKVLEIEKITEAKEAMFDPPAQAEHWTRCSDMKEAELVDRVQPAYPASARTNREQGRVILYAVIEEDGSVSHMAIIQRATPALEAAAVQAVRHWHYNAAECGQSPIRIETSISVDFWLQY